MGATDEITNTEDIIDSRDVIERIEYLESQVSDDDGSMRTDAEELELQALRNLAEKASGYAPDWQYGETLIRDSYFKDYAQQLAEDIGAIDPGAKWPNDCIDWERAARELRMDYTSVEFDGVTYWLRS